MLKSKEWHMVALAKFSVTINWGIMWVHDPVRVRWGDHHCMVWNSSYAAAGLPRPTLCSSWPGCDLHFKDLSDKIHMDFSLYYKWAIFSQALLRRARLISHKYLWEMAFPRAPRGLWNRMLLLFPVPDFLDQARGFSCSVWWRALKVNTSMPFGKLYFSVSKVIIIIYAYRF